MIKLPGQVGYKQTNRSDTLGSLWSTFNINLQDNLGKVRVSPRLKTNTVTNGVPVAFARYGQRLWAVAGTTIYRNTTDLTGYPSAPFSADGSTSASTDYSSNQSDLLGAWGVLFATAPTRLRSLSAPDGGTWSDRYTMIVSSAHKMVYFHKFDRLYFVDGNVIKSINEAFAVAITGEDYTLTSHTYTGIVDMKTTSQYIWLAVQSTGGVLDTAGEVWRWDGITNTRTIYKIPGARAVVALVIDRTRDLPLAMSDLGILYDFNGAGFSEVGRLPYTNQRPYMGSSPTSINADRFIHPNGMYFTKNGTIRCLINGINGDNAGTQNENLSSGIWEWSPDAGFIHIGSPSYDPISSSITDYGQSRVSRVGALTDMNIFSTASGKDGTLLAGVSVFTDASTVSPAIFHDNSLDTIQKAGYLVTTKIFSENIEDTWQKFYVRHKKLLDSGDIISVKYRTSEEPPIEATITWTSTTTFTTTVDISAYLNYEVEILNGKGGGKTAKITSIVFSTPTYTVTVDSPFTGATSGTAKARFQKWIQIGLENVQSKSWFESPIGKNETWIEFKIFMQFKGTDEIDDFAIANTQHKPIT